MAGDEPDAADVFPPDSGILSSSAAAKSELALAAFWVLSASLNLTDAAEAEALRWRGPDAAADEVGVGGEVNGCEVVASFAAEVDDNMVASVDNSALRDLTNFHFTYFSFKVKSVALWYDHQLTSLALSQCGHWPASGCFWRAILCSPLLGKYFILCK